MIKLTIILILALITLFGWLFLKSNNQKIKTLKNNTTILHQIDPSSRDVKVLYDVFSWGREAMGEYLYYGEIDSHAIKKDGTGDISTANIFLQVDVNFEDDVIRVARNNLDNYLSHSHPNFSIEDDIDGHPIKKMTPMKISSLLNSPDYVGIIELNENSYSTLNVYSDINVAFFEFNKIEQDRVIEIKVWAKGSKNKIGWMYSKFLELIDKYKNIPMNRFAGAIRE